MDLARNAAFMYADAVAAGIQAVWYPSGHTSQEALDALNGNAVSMMNKSAAAVAHLLADNDLRTIFLERCAARSVEVVIANGLPTFPAKLATTDHNDGSVTINA